MNNTSVWRMALQLGYTTTMIAMVYSLSRCAPEQDCIRAIFLSNSKPPQLQIEASHWLILDCRGSAGPHAKLDHACAQHGLNHKIWTWNCTPLPTGPSPALTPTQGFQARRHGRHHHHHHHQPPPTLPQCEKTPWALCTLNFRQILLILITKIRKLFKNDTKLSQSSDQNHTTKMPRATPSHSRATSDGNTLNPTLKAST